MQKAFSAIDHKKLIFVIVSCAILTLGFYRNLWHGADSNFHGFQLDSESLVIGRLALSQNRGMFTQGALLGRYQSHKREEVNEFQYKVYQEGLNVDSLGFTTYNSQSAGQAMAFGLIQNLSPFSNTTNLKLFKLITSLLSALVFTCFLVWVNNNFGIWPACITLILLVLSHWTVLFGRNLYWSLWAFYIPFLSVLALTAYEQKSEKSLTLTRIGLIISLSLFLKCFFTGFEYMTTTLVMMVTPLIFYAILNSWSIKKLFQRFGISVAVSLVVTLISFTILAYQISFVKGSIAEGFKFIAFSFFKRTYGNPSEFPEAYRASLNSNIPEVLQIYFRGAAFDFNHIIPNTIWKNLYIIDFGELVLIFMIITVLSLMSSQFSPRLAKARKRHIALLATLWFSITAPLSWFILFKAHSYIHTGMNYITWYMPFALLGFALAGSTTYLGTKDCLDYLRKIPVVIRKAILVAFGILLLLLAGLFVATKVKKHELLSQIETAEADFTASNGMKIYLAEGNIFILKENFTSEDINTKFFLHLFPSNKSVLPSNRQKVGFDNWDFMAEQYRVTAPRWLDEHKDLLIQRVLPSYDLRALRLGQFNKHGKLWEEEINIASTHH
ncbi:MAG: hypothetical protein KDC99_02550 [Cyclobacteriaceae bacterium]|nr:hypothetical protein [Cyclobacteriaceae bacterium]